MENIIELKCTCGNCGAIISYRAGDSGQIIECPECKEKSRLPEVSGLKMIPKNEPVAPPRLCPSCGAHMAPYGATCLACDNRRRRTIGLVVGIVSAAAVLAVGWMFLKKFYNPGAPHPTALHPAEPVGGVLSQPRVPTVKSMKDFKVGLFWLEQKRGSDLMIAVGDIQNISANVYLHVKVDVDLLDAQGAKIGSVSEEARELLPDRTLHIVSMVKDPRAKSVRFAAIKEIP